MTEHFTNQIKAAAIRHGNKGRVLPALIVAQGILESAAGTSELAVNANNFFGIKVSAGWTGDWYSKTSPEWSEEKGWYNAVSVFRKYPDLEACVIDLVAKYQTPRYATVLGKTDLYEAAAEAWVCGYATDPTYPQKLLMVYEQHKLEGMGLQLAEKVWAIGAGHAGFGVTPGKRGPDGKPEWTWNNAVVMAAIAHMTTRYTGVKILRVDDPTGRTDVPLATRERRVEAAKADAYTSVHHNAMGSTWRNGGLGVETFVMDPISANPRSHALAKEVHPRVVKAMGLMDRGIKGGNFYVLRETDNVPAILTEGGFMDSRVDRAAMDNPAKIRAQGVAIADGVAAFLKLQTAAIAPVKVAAKWFRVRLSWADEKSQIGAFVVLEEAKKLADSRQAEGYQVFDPAGKVVYQPALQWFRVMKDWDNKKTQLSAHLSMDIAMKSAAAAQGEYKVYDEAGNVVYTPTLSSIPVLPPNAAPDHEKEEVPEKDRVHGSLAPEWEEAKAMKMTDGSNPNDFVTKVQSTVITLRAIKTIMQEIENMKK